MGEILAALHPHGPAKTLLTHEWVLNIRKVQTLSSRCNLANLCLLVGGSLEGGEERKRYTNIKHTRQMLKALWDPTERKTNKNTSAGV